MNITKKTSAVLCLFVLIALFFTVYAQEPSNPRETLKQYVADLQKSPNHQALREKIIQLVLTMDPKPAIPDEVAMHEGAAEYAFKNAETVADYADAAKEYEKALLAAPWIAADYFNCGVAHEKAGSFDAAIRNFNLYLIAAPDTTDATDVRKRIGGLKYAAGKAAREETRKPAQLDVSGMWSEFGRYGDDPEGDAKSNRFFHYEFEIQDGWLVKTMVCDIATREEDRLGSPAPKGDRTELWTLRLIGNKFSGTDRVDNSFEGEIKGDIIIVHWLNVGGRIIRYTRQF